MVSQVKCPNCNNGFLRCPEHGENKPHPAPEEGGKQCIPPTCNSCNANGWVFK